MGSISTCWHVRKSRMSAQNTDVVSDCAMDLVKWGLGFLVLDMCFFLLLCLCGSLMVTLCFCHCVELQWLLLLGDDSCLLLCAYGV